MNTVTTIILLFAVVALGYLYWNAKKKLKTAENLKASAIRESNSLENIITNGKAENSRLSDELNQFKTHRGQLEKEHNILKNAYEVKNQTINDLKAENAVLNEEQQQLQQRMIEEFGDRNEQKYASQLEEVNLEALDYLEESFRYKGNCEFNCNVIEIDVSVLVEKEFITPFESLITDKILPASLLEQTDINQDNQKIIIWTQKFNEEGDALRSLSFTEIFNQINTKKKMLNDFMKKETESAKRLKTISNALSKNGRKEVANA